MLVMEVGTFVIILAAGFGLMAWAFMTSTTKGHTTGTSMFHIMAGGLFFVLYITLVSGYEVSATSTITDGTTTWTETKAYIEGGETTSWVGYIFMALGIFNFVVILRHFWEGN